MMIYFCIRVEGLNILSDW